MAESETTHRDVAFIGLGSMGLPMAARLVERGYSVVVVPHRSRTGAERLARSGASIAHTPAAAAATSSVVITMLPTADIVEMVLLGPEGIVNTARPGTVVVDMSTIGPQSATSTAERLIQSGVDFLDAPVSGGPARAATGDLTIMVGGAAETLQSVRPVLETMGKAIFHVGAVGSGQVVKVCNNLVGAACMLANAEALALGAAHGIDPTTTREVLLAGTAANWQLDKTVPLTVLADDYTARFALSLLNKDLRIAGEMALAHAVPSFVGDLVRSVYQRTESRFGGKRDFSSAYCLYGHTQPPDN